MEKKQLNIELYHKIYFLRQVEEIIQSEYHKDEMKTPMHMSMGSEAIVAGVCSVLRKQDQVLGTYRSHALYLAKTGESDRFFAEIFGKETGVANGKAGSMHLSSPEHGLLCCSAIVGSTISVATGVALANKIQKNDRIVVAFLGDGATGTGTFWESFNFACANKLQIIYAIENNGLIVHSDPKKLSGYDDINDVIKNYNCHSYQSHTTDIEEVHNLTQTIIQDMKKNPAPSFVTIEYHRYLEHVGIAEDYEDGYRSRDDYEKWKKVDPVKIQREKLIKMNFCTEIELESIENSIKDRIGSSIQAARDAKFADVNELYQGVFI